MLSWHVLPHWLYETLAMLVEAHYDEFIQDDLDYQNELTQWARARIRQVDKEGRITGAALTTYLTKQNHAIAIHFNEHTLDFILELVARETGFSRLTFKMDLNL